MLGPFDTESLGITMCVMLRDIGRLGGKSLVQCREQACIYEPNVMGNHLLRVAIISQMYAQVKQDTALVDLQ